MGPAYDFAIAAAWADHQIDARHAAIDVARGVALLALAMAAATIADEPCLTRVIAAATVQWLDVRVDTEAITIEGAR